MWLNIERLEESLSTRTIGRRIIYLTSTSSTQDVARREAEEGAPEGTAVIAEEQTAGRGRLGRAWVSPSGRNIYVTLLLRPDAARLRALAMESPLAVLRAVATTTGLSPSLKWPNDVLQSGRKLSGVLIDSELSGGEVRYALVGIGINVNFEIDPGSEIAEIATSIRRELGRETSREDLLAALFNEFEDLYVRASPDAVHKAWRAHLETLGREVTVTFGSTTHQGVAEDVTAEGSLVLRRPDGGTTLIEAGEVTLRPPAG